MLNLKNKIKNYIILVFALLAIPITLVHAGGLDGWDPDKDLAFVVLSCFIFFILKSWIDFLILYLFLKKYIKTAFIVFISLVINAISLPLLYFFTKFYPPDLITILLKQLINFNLFKPLIFLIIIESFLVFLSTRILFSNGLANKPIGLIKSSIISLIINTIPFLFSIFMSQVLAIIFYIMVGTLIALMRFYLKV